MKTLYQIKLGIKRSLWFLNRLQYKAFGKNSVINKPLMLSGKKYMEIGNKVTIRDGARIEMISEWNHKEYHPSLQIGDGTSIEQNLHLICSDIVRIGKNCALAGRCSIITVDHEYSDVERGGVLKQGIASQEVMIGDNCFFGMDVKVFPGVHIGNNVIVGANSIVMNDIPAYSVCVGVPARVIKTYNFETKTWVKV